MSSRTAILISIAAFAAVLAGCHRPYYMARHAPGVGVYTYNGIPVAPVVPYGPAVSGTVSYYNVHSCPGYTYCPYGCHTRRTVHPVPVAVPTYYTTVPYRTYDRYPPRVVTRTTGGYASATYGNPPVQRTYPGTNPHSSGPSHGRPPAAGTQGTWRNSHGSANPHASAPSHGRPASGTQGTPGNSHGSQSAAPQGPSRGPGATHGGTPPGVRRIGEALVPALPRVVR
jgi:hypothetical protein